MAAGGLDVKTVAKDFSHELGFEFWIVDHKDITKDVLLEYFPKFDGDGDDTPEHRQVNLDKARNGLIAARNEADIPMPDPKELQKTNDWWMAYWNEKRMDTVAVGVKGDTIYIAANVKKRGLRKAIEDGTGDNNIPRENLGLHNGRHDAMIRLACKEFNERNKVNYRYVLLSPEDVPKDNKQNAERHAEMQIYAYLYQERGADTTLNLGINVIGVSKPLCDKCNDFVINHNVNAVANSRYFLNEPTVAEVRAMVTKAKEKAENVVKVIREIIELKKEVKKEQDKVEQTQEDKDRADKAAKEAQAAKDKGETLTPEQNQLIAAKHAAAKKLNAAQKKRQGAEKRLASAMKRKLEARAIFDVARERAGVAEKNPELFSINVPPVNWMNPVEARFGKMSAVPIYQPLSN